MAIGTAVFIEIASQAVAGTGLAGPSGGSGLLGISLGDWPAWLQLLLALTGLMSTFVIYQTSVLLDRRIPEPVKNAATDFVSMLCQQIGESSERISLVFAQRLRQPPGDLTAMRILVRHLREDLSVPMNFITQMRAHPPGDWHGMEVFRAFTSWSAQVVAMAKQLDDLHEAISFPLLREPVDKHAEAMLIHQYLIEQAFMDRRIDDITSRAHAFCAVACKILNHDKTKSKDGEADAADCHCPCCRHPAERHRHGVRDPLQPIILPAPPTPPAPPPKSAPVATPVPKPCRCVMASPCHCLRQCPCACQCTHAAIASAAV